ncbi:amidohydrolase family protein [Pontixanthobacter gangjinensis]
MHMHAHPVGGLPPLEPVTGFMAPETSEELRAKTLEEYEKNNVVLAVTSGSQDHLYKASAPDLIIKGFGLMGNENLDSLRAKVKDENYKLFAEAGPQYLGMDPTDERLEPYFALAEELDIPIGLHMGLGPPGAAYMGMKDYRMSDSNPLLLEETLINHPDLRIFVCHAGWPFLDEMIGLMYAHPQVYVDISVINWVRPKADFYRYLKALVDAGFADRIMYGSDQMQWPQSISMSIDAIKEAPFLKEEEKKAILYGNAARFLKLGEETIRSHYNAEAD